MNYSDLIEDFESFRYSILSYCMCNVNDGSRAYSLNLLKLFLNRVGFFDTWYETLMSDVRMHENRDLIYRASNGVFGLNIKDLFNKHKEYINENKKHKN